MVAYKYKYNGKEWQDELGLNFYDYGARNYDPAIGRWMNIDPLAYKYFSFSLYCYALNIPTVFVDPDGKRVLWGNGDADKKVKEQVDKLRTKSESFNALYEFLDGLEDFDITISIDDNYVEKIAEENNQDKENAQGFFDTKTNTAFIKTDVSVSIVGEEMFHGMQKYINGKRANNQNLVDKEAEAKLFNYDVAEEVLYYNNPGSLGGIILDSSQYEIYNVKSSQEESGSSNIEGSKKKNIYDGYVRAFYEFYNSAYGNKHQYSKKPPLYSKPATYNEIQDLKKINKK